MWKLFSIAGTQEFHTPPTAHMLPAVFLLRDTGKVVSGLGKAFAWYLPGFGMCMLGEPSALSHPLGKTHV